MSILKQLLSRLGRRSLLQDVPLSDLAQLQVEALVQAHGDWMALLATILEREGVITSAELAHTLADFAAHTAEDRPAAGHILFFWASRLNDAAATVGKFSSIH